MTDRAGDPLRVPLNFWERPEVMDALRRRDVGLLLNLVRRHTGAGQTKIGAAVGLSQSAVSEIMAGKRLVTASMVYSRIAAGLAMPSQARLAFGLAASPPRSLLPADGAAVPNEASQATMDRIRTLRRGVDEVVSENSMSAASIEDWEQTILRHGSSTRYRPAAALLDELTADFAELTSRLSRRQPISTLRRLTHMTAQMAGLMSLTLLKLNQHEEAHHWARTARHAADEADEPRVRAWVRVQEAYAHYYQGAMPAAIHSAREAQAIAARTPCAGVALCGALEARAHAALRSAVAADHALMRTRATLDSLTDEERARSAFGYDEAQLLFHEGNVHTHLHNTDAAWRSQRRALDLYPEADYMDRALIHLDRASCLAYDGDVRTAIDQALATLLALSRDERRGLIATRGREVLEVMPAAHRRLPAADELRELLEITDREAQ